MRKDMIGMCLRSCKLDDIISRILLKKMLNLVYLLFKQPCKCPGLGLSEPSEGDC